MAYFVIGKNAKRAESSGQYFILFISVLFLGAIFLSCTDREKAGGEDGYLKIKDISSFVHVLEQNPNGVLANRDGGQIRTQIISFQFVEGNKVYFCTGSEKPLYEQLKAFPYVSYCTYPDDFEPVLSLNGKVFFSDDSTLKYRAFNGTGYAGEFVRNHYKNADNPNLKLFFLDVDKIETYDSNGAKIYRISK